VKVLRSEEGLVGQGTRCQPEATGDQPPEGWNREGTPRGQARRWASHRKQGAKVQHELSEEVAGMR
jgi:hypothetical protein